MIRMVYEVARATAAQASAPLCRVRMPGRGLAGRVRDTRRGRQTWGSRSCWPGATRGPWPPAFAAWCGLTSRETQVLAGLADGLATKALARSLSISPQTVDDHLKSIYRKAHVHGRDELLALLR